MGLGARLAIISALVATPVYGVGVGAGVDAPAPRPEVKSEPGAELSPFAPGPFRYVDVRVAPIGLLSGVYGAQLDVGFARAFTVGALVSGFKAPNNTSDSSFYQFGAQLTYAFSRERFTTSWYFEALAMYVPSDIHRVSSGTELSGTLKGYALGAVAGYQWFYPAGFNLALGTGVSYLFTGRNVQLTGAGGRSVLAGVSVAQGLQPVLEAKMGWAF